VLSGFGGVGGPGGFTTSADVQLACGVVPGLPAALLSQQQWLPVGQASATLGCVVTAVGGWYMVNV